MLTGSPPDQFVPPGHHRDVLAKLDAVHPRPPHQWPYGMGIEADGEAEAVGVTCFAASVSR